MKLLFYYINYTITLFYLFIYFSLKRFKYLKSDECSSVLLNKVLFFHC